MVEDGEEDRGVVEDGGWEKQRENAEGRREEEDEREKVQQKNQFCPCILLEITKITLANLGVFLSIL